MTARADLFVSDLARLGALQDGRQAALNARAGSPRLSPPDELWSGVGPCCLLKGVSMSGKDRGQKSVKKPAKQTLKEKRVAKRGKAEEPELIQTKKRS